MAKKINKAGLELIKKSEGVRLEAYLDPAGVWTIGYGHTGSVKEGDKITQEQAEKLLKSDLEMFESYVENLVDINLNENQFSALVSFTYNVGPGALEKSTLLKKVNSNQLDDAADEFKVWIRANGMVLDGLVKRREEERKLFLQPVSKPNTKPKPGTKHKTTDELAREVIAGDHGDGVTRKKRLGDRFEDVQKRVNHILINDSKPVSDTSGKSISQLADEVIKGLHGSGRERMLSLGANYAKVQIEVTRRMRKK